MDFRMKFAGRAPGIDVRGAPEMARNDRKSSETGKKTGGSRADARRSHSIRFTDSEWKLIEKAAARQGIPAGEFARSGALALAEDRLGEPAPATLSAGHAALIEEIYRFACAMATLRRNELLDARRDDDLVDLVEQAREAMKGTMEEGSA